MSALDEVLKAYRDMFGVKTERANETHRLACEEVARLRAAQPGEQTDGGEVLPPHKHVYIDGYCACGMYVERRRGAEGAEG